MYMDVRYEGSTHGVTGSIEPDLILTDDGGQIVSTSYNVPVAFMGMLSDLYQWHLDDPVENDERERNEVVYLHQGNRNPFVDHPEWVECLYFGTGCDEGEIFSNGFESGDTTWWSGSVP